MTDPNNPPDDATMRSLAHACERDLNSHEAKVGHAHSDSALESGVDKGYVESKFAAQDAHVVYGSASTGRVIPAQEGGDQIGKGGGRPTKDKDFEGPGGPEDKRRIAMRDRPGDDDV
ncbi:hypothetical protein EDC01DRAFT_780435 [Geopyxis carbonaria]|nr:hypothetical protein EDC01DRAFT_780435 [Geopyxis carbonaria]